MMRTTIELIAVSRETLQKAESVIRGCETCSQTAGLPFSWVLDRVTDRNPAITDYVLPRPARCGRCGGGVFEKSLVDW
jgi:hypothetical protein